MSAHDLVSRLDHCKPTGKDTWIARCPAHNDGSPSLSIKELPDGRVLVNCFAGCGALEVISAVGLEWEALFPPTDKHLYRSTLRLRERTVDELVLAIADADRQAGKQQSVEDMEREAEAFARVMLNEPSPEPDDMKDLFCTYAYREQKKLKKFKKKVAVPEEIANQSVEEWLQDYFGKEDGEMKVEVAETP